MAREKDETALELEALQAAGIEALRNKRPAVPPLIFHLVPLVDWFEERHIDLIRQHDFPEARRAFNPVFIHLPADGCRLTELASRASMSKQAMAELVDELVERGYLARFPDPRDGRAKLIVRTRKGLDIHFATIAAFARIEQELEAMLGGEALRDLRGRLELACRAIAAPAD